MHLLEIITLTLLCLLLQWLFSIYHVSLWPVIFPPSVIVCNNWVFYYFMRCQWLAWLTAINTISKFLLTVAYHFKKRNTLENYILCLNVYPFQLSLFRTFNISFQLVALFLLDNMVMYSLHSTWSNEKFVQLFETIWLQKGIYSTFT